MDHSEKLKLYGFNNLTKALSFNIYDVCYAKTPREQKDYIAYIDRAVQFGTSDPDPNVADGYDRGNGYLSISQPGL